MALARHEFNVQDLFGNAVTVANVEVRKESDGLVATIYSDRDGASPQANPFSVDPTTGIGAFHALGGAYKVTVTSPQGTRVKRYVPVGTAQESDTGGLGIASTPRGNWDSITTYAINDVVEHDGATFISNSDTNLNHEPDTDPTPDSSIWWTYIAGPTGPQGEQGEQGIQGPVGATGVAGPGLQPKNSVAAATVSAITLSGEQTVDGVALVTGDRCLVKNQASLPTNGIYVVDSGAWVRAADFDIWDEVPRALVAVLAGTVNDETSWVCTAVSSGVIDVTSITFARVPVVMVTMVHQVWAGPYSMPLIPGATDNATRQANSDAINSILATAQAQNIKNTWITNGRYSCIKTSPILVGTTGPDQKSMALRGLGGGAAENHNTILSFLDVEDGDAAVDIGNGQFMEIHDLTVECTRTDATNTKFRTGVGIAFNHNIHQFLASNVRSIGFGFGFQTGFDGDVLCDSGTFWKCSAVGCNVGYDILRSQNYIMSLYDCLASGCLTDLRAISGKNVNVFGGNFSNTDAASETLIVSDVDYLGTVLTENPLDGNHLNTFGFSAVVSSPSALFEGDGYDAYAIELEHFGVVPCILTNWEPSTNIGTFQIYEPWLVCFPFHDNDSGLTTILEADFAAVIEIHACQRVRIFHGTGIKCVGLHVENPHVLTTLADVSTSVNGANEVHFDNVFFNYNPTHVDSGAGDRVYLCQQVWGFIESWQYNPGIHIKLSNISCNAYVNDRLCMVLVDGGGPYSPRLVTDLCELRFNIGIGPFNSYRAGWGIHRGPTVYAPASGGYDIFFGRQVINTFSGPGPTTFHGPFPEVGAPMFLGTDYLAEIEAGTHNINDNPPILGGRLYQLGVRGKSDTMQQNANNPSAMIMSSHLGWTYAKAAFTAVNWDTVGHSRVVFLDSNIGYMFAGLVIMLDGGSLDDTELLMITSVHHSLGYVKVSRYSSGNPYADFAINGTAGTEFSGTGVLQQTLSIGRLSMLPKNKVTTKNNTSGFFLAEGEITRAEEVMLLLTGNGTFDVFTEAGQEFFIDVPGSYAGYTYRLTVANSGTGNKTLQPGDGNVTITGGTVNAGTWKEYVVTHGVFPAVTLTPVRSGTLV